MMKKMHEPLDLTTAELVAQSKKDGFADVGAYDEVHEQIWKMADMLTDGILGPSPGSSR